MFAQAPFDLIRAFIRQRSPFQLAVIIASLLLPVGFVLYTNQVWEDFLITYRHSENLVRGHGLVYTPGERVHGFTSPLNVLLPALFGWVTQARDFVLPLWMFRLVSLAGLAVAVAAVASVITTDQPRDRLSWYICGLFPFAALLEIKTTAFAMNGQESGLMLAFVALTFVLAYRGWPRSSVLAGGLCLAGLMYTRPDGFVYATAIGISGWIFCADSRREFVTSFAMSAVVGLIIYLPWLLFAQVYYGSFIPHTITAKNGTEGFSTATFGLFAPVAAGIALLPEKLWSTFGAIYDSPVAGPATWPKWAHDTAFALESAAVLYWLIPGPDRLGRMASLCSLGFLAYLTAANLVAFSSPWYFPTLAFLSIVALVRMFATLPTRLGRRTAGAVSAMLMTGLLLFLGFVFVASWRGLRLKQDVIENSHRRPLGLWLKANVPAGQTVFLEPIGYIGYYSQCKLLDWPGLVSPEVVAARRKIGTPESPWGRYYWGLAVAELKPDWVVARPDEEEQMAASAFIRANYTRVQVFDVKAKVQAAGTFYGSAILDYDTRFTVFRRRP